MTPDHPARTSRRPRRLGLLAILLIPLLLVLHAPILAAVVPGTMLAVASLRALDHQPSRALPSAELVEAHDVQTLERIARATPVAGQSRRIS